MTIELASYIAGIVAAIAGIGSLYFALAQYRREKEGAALKNAEPTHRYEPPLSVNTKEPKKEKSFQFERSGVPDDLLLALETTKGMFNKPARDAALKALATKAAALGNVEFAVAAVSEMWHCSTKDELLLKLVKEALNVRDAHLAHRATELFFNKRNMDDAKRLIIDWVGHDKE